MAANLTVCIVERLRYTVENVKIAANLVEVRTDWHRDTPAYSMC